MFILMPSCESRRPIAEISVALLDRYWPGHPEVAIVRHDPWLEGVAGLVGSAGNGPFILLLDDYGVCGGPRLDLICHALRRIDRDPSIGMIPLCWYPARKRARRDDGLVALTGCPILLQAAIWSPRWFLSLAERMEPRSSAWGFEAQATPLAARMSMQICAPDFNEPAWLGGRLIDGFEKCGWPLPYHNLTDHGDLDPAHVPFLIDHGFNVPSRGLGDLIAKAFHRLRLDSAWRAIAKRPCGCAGRRERLNEMVPFRRSSKVADGRSRDI